MRRVIVVCALTLAAASMLPMPAAVGSTPSPGAAAWAVRIDLPDQPGALLLADASAVAGDDPAASGVPFELAGQGTPERATATPEDPDVVHSLNDYDDQTGSLSIQQGFAEAHATSSSTSARAGFDQMTGSGFALADELFTFEQQAQMLEQWQQANDAIFGPLNEVADTLAPVLGAAGLTLPDLEPISPIGLVDALRASTVTSSVEASSSPGFASARARSTVRDLTLFGGFLVIDVVTVEAIAESVAGVDTRTSSATVGRLKIAGLGVVADDMGLRLAGNEAVPASALRPLLEQLTGALAAAGITIRVADVSAPSALARDAAAIELSVQTPQGPAVLSVGYASAIAPTTTAPPPRPVQIFPDEPGTTAEIRTVPVTRTTFAPPPEQPVARGTRTVSTRPIDRRLPDAVARAMQLVFVIFIAGGLVGAAALPLMSLRARRRPSLPITQEVSP